MRMWMVSPELLCQKHLIGEHGEIHKHRHNFEKCHKITRRIFPIVQIEPMQMEFRHNELVKEMKLRGLNHFSPYQQPDVSYLNDSERLAKVDIKNSLKDLSNRCPECARKINLDIQK